ncbi:hypothetical protein [Sphaerochaeta sp. S2]|uniref:hypothetical protein n=1 Tax=Sphaerochaeta sp. S2 TaxID=2798868 RepID=UPI0018E9B332|nr:hypothetical protein [Sphaerochaeta sp. S2]MBJ2355977.1 hypothetical protein [Sphaerochaeta sp. S2]
MVNWLFLLLKIGCDNKHFEKYVISGLSASLYVGIHTFKIWMKSIFLEEDVSMRKIRIILLVMITLTAMIGLISCDEADALGLQITEVTTTKDTVTITFSDTITSVTMPNTIVFGDSTYYFSIKDTTGNSVDLGLMNQSENSITVAVLGKTSSAISGTYSFEVSTDEAGSLVKASKDISFQSWNGTNWYIDVYGPGADLFMVQVLDNPQEANESNLITGLVAADFSAFDADGNKLSFTFSSERGEEFNLHFASSLINGNYWVRIVKTGYNPSYELVTLPSE